jgi:putative colanic acid biosysnthesis UDP-glucose lipid carrier transferase
MSEPIYSNSGLKVGLIALVQAIAPAAIVVTTLYLLALLEGTEFDPFYRSLAFLAGVLSLMFMRLRDNGRPVIMMHPVIIGLQLLLRWLAIVAVVLVAGYVTGFSPAFSTELIVAWALLVPFILLPVAMLLHTAMRWATMYKDNVRAAVMVGFNPHGRGLAEKFTNHPELCRQVLGFFDDRSADRLGAMGDFRLLGKLSALPEYVRANKVKVIYVTLPVRHLERVRNLLDELHDTTASVYYVPDVFVFDLIQSHAGEILGTPVVALCESPFRGYRSALKRATDVIFTLMALVALLPLMLLLAIVIRLTSPGPVIFKQRRYGLDGQEIIVYKFRSMHVTEDGAKIEQVSREDPRVTPIGRILRSYSLDELPQFINVLQGRMSLVGPRPHAVAHNEQYRRLIKGYMLRHKVRPGITGLAQVNGCRGETRTIEEMEARVRYDLTYLRTWTPLLDFKILLLTVVRVFRDSKAY